MVHLKGNSTRKSTNKPGNKNGKSASNSVRLRIGNFNATRKAIQNAVASKRQSVVTVAVPKNNPGLLAHIKRLLGMNNGR